MQEQERGVKRPDFPEQAMLDPFTGKNITGDIVAESKDSLAKTMDALLAEAKKRAQRGEPAEKIFNDLAPEVQNAIADHYRSMKLPTDHTALSNAMEELAKAAGADP